MFCSFSSSTDLPVSFDRITRSLVYDLVADSNWSCVILVVAPLALSNSKKVPKNVEVSSSVRPNFANSSMVTSLSLFMNGTICGMPRSTVPKSLASVLELSCIRLMNLVRGINVSSCALRNATMEEPKDAPV